MHLKLWFLGISALMYPAEVVIATSTGFVGADDPQFVRTNVTVAFGTAALALFFTGPESCVTWP